MKHKTKVIYFLLAAVLIIGVAYVLVWARQSNSGSISESLSDQSEERVEQMKSEGSVTRTFRETANQAGKILSTDCFSFSIPLAYGNVKTDKAECRVRVQLKEPRGALVITAEQQREPLPLSELAAVKFRREDTRYEPVVLSNVEYDYKSFSTSSELTTFLKAPPYIVTLSFSKLPTVNQEIISATETTTDSLSIFSIE